VKIKVFWSVISVFIASIIINILFVNMNMVVPKSLEYVKLIGLLVLTLFFYLNKKLRSLIKLTVVLSTIVSTNILTQLVRESNSWISTFDSKSFILNIGGSILLKMIGVIPIIILLLILFKSFENAYLSKGDLTAKANKISWLGIEGNKITWIKLSIISGILISSGTILLTLFTVTQLRLSHGIENLIQYIPIIVIFALLNSLCEGIVYRSALLSSFQNVLPKNTSILIAAILFGSGHYYGAPGGIVGAIMASVLGWYMCRSMFETKGFLTSWIIHFMQDIVIFSTLFLFGNFI